MASSTQVLLCALALPLCGAYVTATPRSLDSEVHRPEDDATVCAMCMESVQAGKDAFIASHPHNNEESLKHFQTAFIDDLVENCTKIFPGRTCKVCAHCVEDMEPGDVDIFMQRSNADICSKVSKLDCAEEQPLHAQDAVAQAAFEGLSDWLKKQAAEEAKHVHTLGKCTDA